MHVVKTSIRRLLKHRKGLYILCTVVFLGIVSAVFVWQDQRGDLNSPHSAPMQSDGEDKKAEHDAADDAVAPREQIVKEDRTNKDARNVTSEGSSSTPQSESNSQQPEYPKPQFKIVLDAPPSWSSNSFGFIIKVIPDPNDQNVDYAEPSVIPGPAGLPHCDGTIYNTGNLNEWGWNCVMYGGAEYGEWPVSFSVIATNGYGKKSTSTASGVVVFYEGQISYQNRY